MKDEKFIGVKKKALPFDFEGCEKDFEGCEKARVS